MILLFLFFLCTLTHMPIASSLSSSALSPPANTGHLNATTISSLHHFSLLIIHFLSVSFYHGRPPSDADRYFYYHYFLSCVHLRNEFKTLWIPQFPPFLSPITLLIYILLSLPICCFFLFLSFFIYSFSDTNTHFFLTTETAEKQSTASKHLQIISLLKHYELNCWWSWALFLVDGFVLLWFGSTDTHRHQHKFISLPSNRAFKACTHSAANTVIALLSLPKLSGSSRLLMTKVCCQCAASLPPVRALRNHSGIFISFCFFISFTTFFSFFRTDHTNKSRHLHTRSNRC